MFENQQLTNAGRDALAVALTGERLVFNRMAVGDGALATDEDLADRTDLINWVQNIPIIGKRSAGNGQATITGRLMSIAVETGFFLREIGLFCTLGDDPTEILYSINNAGDQATYIPSHDAETIVVNAIELHIIIGEAENVEAVIELAAGPPGAPGADGTPGIQGLPGPSVISADPGNQARLGSDSYIFVPESGGGTIPTGSIIAFAGQTAPSGYLLCDGAAVSRIDYAALYDVIGTVYGVGDGTTTFNLPDLRGRVEVGLGQGTGLTNRTLGSVVGAETHVLSVDELATHPHEIIQIPHAHTSPVATASIGQLGRYISASSGGNVLLTEPANADITIQPAGLNAPHNNMQPSIVLNKIIKT